MDIKDRILIVEDDKSITNLLTAVLRANHYEVLSAAGAMEAESLISSQCPDLVLLDLGLPDADGTKVIEFVRAYSSLPIIVLSARGQEKDKVTALDLGADDYVVKPFSTPELLARIRTALRHYKPLAPASTLSDEISLSDGRLVVSYGKHRVFVEGRDAGLTQNEYKIVSLLARFPGRVLTYDYILREIWGPHMKEDNRILRVNMANIRRKLEKNPARPEFIFTEAGVGYRMTE